MFMHLPLELPPQLTPAVQDSGPPHFLEARQSLVIRNRLLLKGWAK